MRKLGMEARELDRVRHVLAGDSVVDWRGLDFANYDDVDAHLRLNKVDWHSPRDARYLRGLHAESVHFIEGTLDRKIATEVSTAQDVRDVFLFTGPDLPPDIRMAACFTLKVMNTINHVNGRELLFHVPLSERELVVMAKAEVQRVVDELRRSGFPIFDFEGGEKSREALILKLMAKRETLAAQVFDKIRFRITVEDLDQIAAIVLHLTRRLFPFNYVIPGQSLNEIVRIPDEGDDPVRPGLMPPPQSDRMPNESSGPTYRHLDFVVDLPLRIESLVNLAAEPALERLGCVIHAMIEFQVVDRQTARDNESGLNSHQAYRDRQRDRVLERLERPHVLPKR